MKISKFSQYLQTLEHITSRNQMIEILARLFSEAERDEISELVYLLQGRLGPLFSTIEFGVADKMMIRAIAQAFEVEVKAVRQLFHRIGDLGRTAEELMKRQKSGIRDKESKMSVREVFKALYKVAAAAGVGSQEVKLTRLAQLLQTVDPFSARYIVRVTLGKIRLGFSDMTVLDALSWMISGSKEHRKEIERAYNVRPDLGFIAREVKTKGVKTLSEIAPQPGVPILMARAERLSSAKEIIKKIGKCGVEPKIDGFRLQCHWGKIKKEVKLFSRNLEDVTFMYPDVVEGIRKQVRAKNAIFEGEAVAYDTQTGEYLPFQETVQRKRKYNIEEKAVEVPLKLICFDLLYFNGESYLGEPYARRRKTLEKIIRTGKTLLVAEQHVTKGAEVLERIFDDAVFRGLEGVMAKRLDAEYQAGVRNWNWIKYKRSYRGKLTDTIDAVVMGYDYGQGKRTGFGIGDFLIGVYDKKSDIFKTIAKVGTGLTDEEWREMKKCCDGIRVGKKPVRYDVDKAMRCNVWVEPRMVVVVRADEITRSSVHTAGRVLVPSKSGTAKIVKTPGFALRFPRLEHFRSDKLPEDATTLSEIAKMYKQQGSAREFNSRRRKRK